MFSGQEKFRPLVEVALLLTLAVVALGAYVRLSDAGLGCPDWPGCYGQFWAPNALDDELLGEFSNTREFDPIAARQEMAHRLLAGILGLLLLWLVVVSWRQRRCPRWLSVSLLLALLVQVLLGMLTVTWLLKPIVVTAHLVFGFSIAALLWLVHAFDRCRFPAGKGFLPLRTPELTKKSPVLSPPAVVLFGLTGLALVVQIFLGVWMSSHYASLACVGFPHCNGQWWPAMDFAQGFSLWQKLGVNYEYGVLDSAARVAIHWMHRLNAIVVCLFAVPSMILIYRAGTPGARTAAMLLLILLAVQIGLGIINVLAGLPIANAVTHTVVALFLVLCWLELFTQLWSAKYF